MFGLYFLKYSRVVVCMSTARVVLQIDGSCALCQRTARFLRTHGFTGEIHSQVVSYSSVRLCVGTVVHEKSDAIMHALRYTDSRMLRFCGFLLGLVPRFLRDWVYKIIAQNRLVVGKMCRL